MAAELVLGPALQYEVEQFLYQEAALLDERRYTQWLGLLAEDIHYHLPVRMNRLRRDLAQEYTRPGEQAHFDDRLPSLKARVGRLESGMAWSETPASRTRRLISNVRLQLAEAAQELEVRSHFLVYRSRQESEVDLFAGERLDRLRRGPGGWRIARRTIHLDQATLHTGNLGLFF